MSHLTGIFGIAAPVALVTGSGAPRVGNCIARTLAQRGYRVIVHANHSMADAERTVRELQQQGADAIALSADVADEAAVTHLIDGVLDRFGRIDVLVNSAAIWKPNPLEQVTAAEVRQYLDVNTLGTFLCCQKAGLAMVRQEYGGAIVNMGDWATVRPYRNYAAYFPSKGAIPTLTRDLAVELAARNPRIRVNAILPGPVMLPSEMPEAERQATIAATLVQRVGSPQNVADAVMALVENDFITGVCLPVDGGRSCFTPP